MTFSRPFDSFAVYPFLAGNVTLEEVKGSSGSVYYLIGM